MESTNLQHQQLLASSTSSSSYILLNNGKTHERSQSEVPIIRDLISQKNEQLQDHPHVNHPMMMMMHHDMMMGIPSCPINPININNAPHDHDNAMTIIKDHLEVSYDSSSSSNLTDMLSLKTCTHNHMIMNGVDHHHHHKYQFSQIFPSVNISNLSKSSSLSSSSLLSSSSSSSSSFMGMMNMDVCTSSMTSNPGLDHDAQHSSQLKLTRSHPNNNGDPQAKRPSTNVDSNKKPRFESRASCSPFKVRKEKLGDRIAALQQLVAPFGKTDTASVLMEAIGYIKFLQSQVQTLSIPYMKLSLHKSTGNIQQVSNEDRKKEEPTGLNLRSRGLCLVPLSCMSYITNDTGGGLWPPPPTLNPPRF